ncbi:hypothetical protein PROFUN_15609 [Planoprotostelium fungivorum]|uniref:NrS-1 polymerase-like helicase domain-containing protein n=1 Tax=Planoprotostelium fungivorum TaxID=1890364 RepID=A0A2P6MYP5_9EUKA|nr:hypothetical protein PROFUN_15609 [Planoprotostelium fungivorum]
MAIEKIDKLEAEQPVSRKQRNTKEINSQRAVCTAMMSNKELTSQVDPKQWEYLHQFVAPPINTDSTIGGNFWETCHSKSCIKEKIMHESAASLDCSVSEYCIEAYKGIILFSEDTEPGAMWDLIVLLWEKNYNYTHIRNKTPVKIEDVCFELKTQTEMKGLLCPSCFTRPNQEVAYDAWPIWFGNEFTPWTITPYLLEKTLQGISETHYQGANKRGVILSCRSLYNPIPGASNNLNSFSLYEPRLYLQQDFSSMSVSEAYKNCSIFFGHPEILPEVAIVLYRKEGSGKSIIVDVFGKHFGANYTTINTTRFTSKFNSALNCKILVHWDKGTINDQKTLDMLKNYITASELNIEAKSCPPNQRCALNLGTDNILARHQQDPIVALYFTEISKLNPEDLTVVLQRTSQTTTRKPYPRQL